MAGKKLAFFELCLIGSHVLGLFEKICCIFKLLLDVCGVITAVSERIVGVMFKIDNM